MMKKLNEEKLIAFGFKKAEDVYVFESFLEKSQFKMTVTVKRDNTIEGKVYDPAFGDEYTLHLVEDAQGSFVGTVRDEYKDMLSKIDEMCFDVGYKKHSLVGKILDGVNKRYGVCADFPFEDDLETMVLRRQDSKKWFAIIMSVPKGRLGLTGDGKIDVMNLKINPDELERIVDNEKYFRAYHMNKKMWTTVVLDGRLSAEEILKRVDDSYNLVGKK